MPTKGHATTYHEGVTSRSPKKQPVLIPSVSSSLTIYASNAFLKGDFPHQRITSEQHCDMEFQLSAYRRNHGFCLTTAAWNTLPLFPWVVWENSCSICSAQPCNRLRATLKLQLAVLSLGRNEGGGSLAKPNTLQNRKIQSPVEGSYGTLRYQCQVTYYTEKVILHHNQWLCWKRIESKKWDVEGEGRRNEMKP